MQNKELDAKLDTLEKEIGYCKAGNCNLRRVNGRKQLEITIKSLNKYKELQNAQEDLVRGNVKGDSETAYRTSDSTGKPSEEGGSSASA